MTRTGCRGSASGLEEGALRRIRTSLGTARQRRVDPEEHAVADRLTQAFRSLHQADRGRYLRSLLPGASAAVVARFVSRLSPATEREVVSWLAAFDEARRSEERQLSSRRRTDERWRNFVRGVVWPAGGAPAQWSNFRPCREVRVDGGEVWSPKLQRAVQYESTAEEALIRLFDDEPKVHRYCEQPLRMEYPWLDGARRYVPDLAVQLQDGRAVLVEAKPPTLWIDAVNVAKWNAATRWCALRRWGFVVTDGRRHPEDLLGGADQDDFELLEFLTSDGPVPWRRFRAAWFRSGRSWPQLVAVALTHGFVLLRDGHLMVARARRSPWLDAIRDKRLASSSPGSEPRGEVLDHR